MPTIYYKYEITGRFFEVVNLVFLGDWSFGGASPDAGLLAPDGAGGRAEGEDVPGDNGRVHIILGTTVLRHAGESSDYRKPAGTRGIKLAYFLEVCGNWYKLRTN